MIVVTVTDVEELNSKLVSDRAKIREEGLKTLQGYLNCTGDVSLWTLLDQETAALDQNRIRSASWPGVLHALCTCIDYEVAACKKKGPKLLFAKAFRSFILKADDSSRAGQHLNLLRKVKKLFQHVVEILERVPSFVSDYNNVLCQLLPVFEYRVRMGKKIYADLLHLYLDKAKDMSQNTKVEASSTREEAFRNISTLLCILQNPPGDLPEILLKDITQDFIQIFSKLRDEGRIAKKLLAALNSFITGNGLNIGDAAGNIHCSLKPFMARIWLTTRDKELKDGLVLYVRAQLNLRYILSPEDSEEISILLDLVEKDLDQNGVSMGLHRLDAGREDKAGFVTKAMRSFFELAAVVLFEATRSKAFKSSDASKRRRKTDVAIVIKERLMEGKFMWGGAVCLLIRRFGSKLPIALILLWLEGLAASLDRIILDGINSRNFEGSIWILRHALSLWDFRSTCGQYGFHIDLLVEFTSLPALQRRVFDILTSISRLLLSRSMQEFAILWGQTLQVVGNGGKGLSFPEIVKGESLWKSVWDTLLHWLPLLSNVQVMVEETFRLLGTLAAQSLIPAASIPQDFWDSHRFTESPSGNLLYFITSVFVAPNSPMINGEVETRKKLLDWCLSSLNAQDIYRARFIFGEQLSPRLLATSLLALAFGVIPGISNVYEHLVSLRKELSWPSCEREPYLEPDELEQAQEAELAALDRSDGLLVSEDCVSHQEIIYSGASRDPMPRSSSEALLRRVTSSLLKNLVLATDTTQSFTMSQLLHLNTILANCIRGVERATERWVQPPSDWCCKGAMWEGLANVLERCIALLDDISRALSVQQSPGITSSDPTSIASNRNTALQLFTQTTVDSLQQFVCSVNSCAFVTSGGILDDSSAASVPLLIKFLRTARTAYRSAGEAAAAAADEIGYFGNWMHSAGGDPRTSQNSVVGTRIIDTDLDVEMETGIHGGVGVGDAGHVPSSGMSGISTFGSQEKAGDLRSSLLQVIVVIGRVMPDAACTALSDLLLEEKDPKVQGDILLSLCRTINVTTCNYITVVVSKMQDAVSECQQSESMRYMVVTAMDVVFSSLLYSPEVSKRARGRGTPQEIGNGHRILPGQISLDIAELIGKIVDMGLLLWPTRVKLIGAISKFIVLDPSAAQVLTDKFLVLLHDPEYQVRLHMSRKVAVLFETWDGHDELLQDVCGNFGVKMAKMTTDRGFSVEDTLQGRQEAIMAETALLSLGEIAIASEQVEIDIVFIICAHVAVNLSSRPLACAVLTKVGKQLKYPNRWQYIAQILGQVLTHWVVSNVNVSTLLQIREVLVETSVERDFLQHCCPWLLPWLIYYERVEQIQWLSTTLSLSTPSLVNRYFHSIFAAILPLHLGPDKGIQRRAVKALQVSVLELAAMSEDDRDALIQKRMVQIVCSLFKLCSARDKPQLPYFPKERIVLAIKTVVDGFLDSDQASQEEIIIDKMQVFRPDRVFKLLLELHFELFTALHPRHRRNLLTSLGAVLLVLDSRAAVPSTCRYLIHIILQSIESDALQELCCGLLSDILNVLGSSGLESSNRILGEQLQIIVSKLVSCCLSTQSDVALKSHANKPTIGNSDCPEFSSAFSLLYRLTVEGELSLEEYIKDLDPFPDLPCFERIQALHKFSTGRTLAEELVQFVRRVPNVGSEVRLSSLRNLQDKLHTRRKELYSSSKVHKEHITKSWRCSALVVDAVWRLVQLCDKHGDSDMKNLAGEFLAAVGIGDPHAVVFHLPDKKNDELTWFLETANGNNTDEHVIAISIDFDSGLTEVLLKSIIIQLRSYLIDSDVNVIQLASHTLKGLLSTQKGQEAFLSLDQQEKTYLEIYSRGVNLKLVTDMVDAAKQKSSDSAIPLDDSTIWQTCGVSYDVWICTLTHSLLEHSQDTILRLCQEIISVKASLAELVFPHIFGSLAGEYEPGSELCTLISKQVEEHVFKDTNHSTRSLQLFLNTFNSLRQCFIHSEMARVSPAPKRRESAKIEKPAFSGGNRKKKKISLAGGENASNSDIIRGAHADDDLTSWNKVYWLQIDYLSTARAAQQCAAYFTSVLYIEHWCKESFGSLTLGPPDFSSDDELPSHLELLLRAYTSINEPDGVYGVVRSHKVTSQLLRYEHEGNWGKAVESYDLLLRTVKPAQSGGPFIKMNAEEKHFPSKRVLPTWQLHKGLMRTLQQKGCSHILEMYRSGISQQESGLRLDAEFKEMQFEAAWRTGKWEDANLKCASSKQISFDPATRATGLCYHEHLHSSLKSLIEGDAETYFSNMKLAREEIVTHIAHTSMESTQNVNPLIVKLQILDCVSQAWQMRWKVRHQSKHSAVNVPVENLRSTVDGPLVPPKGQIASFEASWQGNLKQMQAHYDLAEPYIAVHKVLLELLDLRDQIPQHLLQLGSFSRKAGRLNHAGAAIHELKSICSETVGTSDANIHHPLQRVLPRYCLAGRVEEAKILWAEGHQEMAVNLAKYVLQLQSQETDSALLLSLTGKWLAETRSSSSRVILDSYLKRAVELSKSQPGDGTDEQRTTRRCRTHFRLAHYADALYRNHRERLMSTEWQSALRLRKHKMRELEILKQRLSLLRADPHEDPMKVKEYSIKAIELHKQMTIDSEEARHLESDKDHFLSIALENYRCCLCISNKYDLRVVFRLISLWFNLSTNEHVMNAMLETVEKVQSYKFLPLVYQIASRLGSSKEGSKECQGPSSFQKALTFLLKKMATEHPYHSLYQLFALANGDRIKEKQRGKNVFVVDMEKKRAAEELLANLTAKHRDLLSQMKKMIEIYIRLAEMETAPKDANKKLPIPREIRSIRQLELIPVVTAPVPVDYSCQYQQDSFPHYKGFTEGIKIMNGINAPKYIECLGSDGNKYRQLAKSGNDDLRQDAVMEQLFGLVNELLQAHPDTHKRNLSIRTYKVVPFTPSAGVLEWVDGTIPLGEYLLGSNRVGGAHGRYGSNDWTFLECREHMSAAKDKRTAFESVMKNFRPVMHNFFLEKFSRAEDWFEKRLAYTRSVASSSMVGYIVGLGDRHSLNILLDQATAEVVHIDLGVAFEQGLMLKTPERIPFRLTRDVVDGMGVTGVEGVFRRCCEATLSVLRTNKEALLTIIEVFIYDPLYNWALSPLKALQRQQELEELDDSSSDTNTIVEMEGNKDAARALFRIKQKLDGYEGGEMRSLPGQVQQLLQDAQDPESLSQLFPGWGAWV